MPFRHYRESIRLKGFDYSMPGFYFITVCTKNREKLFGEVRGGRMELNTGGLVVLDCWNTIPLHYQTVKLHRFVVMPNHIHGIIEITSITHARKSDYAKRENKYQHIIPGSLGSIVRGFEIGVTKWFRKNTDIYTVWQRNFHDTIIRSPGAFLNISNYIRDNPKNWDRDIFNR
jgi:REP element-mobilizing transposase RayT